MSFTGMTCLAGELCLYLSTVGFVVTLCGPAWSAPVYLALGLLAGAGGMLARQARGALRLLPVLLFLPAFFPVRSVAAVILPLPILFLLVLRSWRGSWQGDYDLVRTLFKAGLGVGALLLVILALAGQTGRFLDAGMPLYVVWLLLSVLNLRLLRSSETALFGGRFCAMNAALVLCVALIGFLLSSDLAVSAAATAVRALYSYVIAPVLFAAICLITILPALFSYLFGLLLQLFRGTQEPPELDLSGVNIAEQFRDYDGTVKETSVWLQRFAIAAAVILFLLAALWIVRRLISGRRSRPRASRSLERESVADGEARRRVRLGNSPREQVRAAYRKYLRLCALLDIPVDGSAASDVIRDSSAPYAGAGDAGELRDKWLRARFSDGEITGDDARRARQLLRRMRESVEKAKKAEKKP